MAEGDRGVSAGLSLLHTEQGGKHYYEVYGVLNKGRTVFARTGDKVLKINGNETQNLSPEEFAKMLSDRSPLLTIHQANTEVGGMDECLESDGFYRSSKEKETLLFKMAMVREADLDKEELNPNDVSTMEEDDLECDDTEDEKMLCVSMTDTSLSVLIGRGCDPGNPCNNCNSKHCRVSEVVVTSKQSEVTSVSRGQIKKYNERAPCLIQSLYNVPISIRTIRDSRICLRTSMESITIYYYKSTILEDLSKGVPVVLNFTDTNQYLKCKYKDDRKEETVLTVDCIDKAKLACIHKDEPITWPFVFYISARGAYRVFESAACSGWFINAKTNPNIVDTDHKEEAASYFSVIFLN